MYYEIEPAVAAGYTEEIYGEYDGQTFDLLVKTDIVMYKKKTAYDIGEEEYILINGWLACFHDVQSHTITKER